MNRRLFYVVIAVLVLLTIYMVSRNYEYQNKKDKRTTVPRMYIKELVKGKATDVKDRRDSYQRGHSKTDDKEVLKHKVIDDVQTFLLFIGYPRSGHTLIGSLIDAHPNAIVANEFDVIGKWQEWRAANKNKYFLFNQLYLNSKKEAKTGYRSATVQHRYNYSVPGQWQGRFRDKILVIGAKKGGKTTRQLMKLQNMEVLKGIQQVLNISVKFLHVVRNPYDNIATMLLRALNKREAANFGEKINDPQNLDKQIGNYFYLAKKNSQLKKLLPGEVYEIHSSELTENPKEILLGICQFLQLSCDHQYIEACSKRIYPEPTETRHSVVWTEQQKDLVKQKLQTFESLKGYRFEN